VDQTIRTLSVNRIKIMGASQGAAASQSQLDPLYVVEKRDDDAYSKIDPQTGDVLVTTSQPLDQMTAFERTDEPSVMDKAAQAVLDSTMLEDAARARPSDVRNTTIYNMFLAHLFVSLAVLVNALPFYWQPIPRVVLIVVICVACTAFAGFYALMLVLRNASDDVRPIAVLSAWTISFGFIIGCAAGLSRNAAPIILMLMLVLQSLVVMVYAKPPCVSASHTSMSSWTALCIMLCATLIAWLINVPTYVSRHDWISGIVVLLIGSACTVYNAHQIRINETRYALGETVKSIIQFYGDPALLLWSQISISNP